METAEPQRQESFFLPDFCALPMVFAVVLLAELFALIIALAPVGRDGDFWSDLAFASLFIQWVALVGAALLCVLRPYLARLNEAAAALVAWLLLVVLVGVFSHFTAWFADRLGIAFEISIGEFVLRNLATGAIVSILILRYFYLQHQWQRRMEAEGEARIQALQARIRPHFLFNSMNTIASLTRSDPNAAEAAIEDLADLFRASLGDARRPIPLRDELELCHRYIHMEGLRLGPRLTMVWETADLPDDAVIPALTLQPLLENAVYHGIEPLPEGGTVRISGRQESDGLILRIENPCPRTGASRQDGNRMAVENIRARLEAHFGARATLDSVAAEGQYTVTLTLPYGGEAAP